MPAVLRHAPSLSALEDGFRVRYLGSLQFPASSNVAGINTLQEPLLELYTNARRRGETNRASHPLSLVQFLDVSDYGLVVLDIEEEDGEPIPIITKVITPVSSVLMWAAVRFHARVVKRKKFGAAFVPLACSDGTVDKKHCVPLATKHRFLVSLTHPPLFVCLHRQVASPKMVECHAFVCAASEDALTICSVLSGTKEESERLGSTGYLPDPHHYRLRSDGASQSEEDIVSTLTPSSVTTLTEATSSRITMDSESRSRSTRQRGRREERYLRSASCPRNDNSSADEIYWQRDTTSPVVGRRYEQRRVHGRTHTTPKLSERFIHPEYGHLPVYTKTSSCEEQIIHGDGIARRKEYKSSSSEETPPYELIASSPDVSSDKHRSQHHSSNTQKCDQILPRYEFGQHEKSFQTNNSHSPTKEYHTMPSKECHVNHGFESDPRMRNRSALRRSTPNLDIESTSRNRSAIPQAYETADNPQRQTNGRQQEHFFRNNNTEVHNEYLRNPSPIPVKKTYRSLHDIRNNNQQTSEYDLDSLDGRPEPKPSTIHHQSPSYRHADLDLMDRFDYPVMREAGTMTEPRMKSKVTCIVNELNNPPKANAEIQTDRDANFKGSMILQETMDLSSESEYSVAIKPPPRRKEQNGIDKGVWVHPSTFISDESHQKIDQARPEELRTYRSQQTQADTNHSYRDNDAGAEDFRKYKSLQTKIEPNFVHETDEDLRKYRSQQTQAHANYLQEHDDQDDLRKFRSLQPHSGSNYSNKADNTRTDFRKYRSHQTLEEAHYSHDDSDHNEATGKSEPYRNYHSQPQQMDYYEDGYVDSDSNRDINGNGTSRVTISVPYYRKANSQASDISRPGSSSRTSYLPHGIRSFQRSGEVRNWSTVSSETSYPGTSTLPIPRANRHQPKVIRWSSVERLPRRRRNILSSLKRFSIRSLARAKQKTNQLFNSLRTKVKDQMTLKKSADLSEDSAYDTSEVCLSPDGGGKKHSAVKKHRRQSWSFHDLRAEFPTGRPTTKKDNGSKKNVNPGPGPSGAATRAVNGSRKMRKRRRKAATDSEMSSDSGVEEYPSDFSDTCRRPKSNSEMQQFATEVTKIKVDHGKSARDFRRWSQTDLHSELGYIP